MAMTSSGLLESERPNQPQEDAYVTPDVFLRGLNLGGKYDEQQVGNRTLPLALHHVIPWNLLRDFWNKLQGCNYWKSMAVYGSMLGVAQSTMGTATSRMKKSRFGDAIDLDEKLCWAQWNLVRGPQYRPKSNAPGEDPGEDLDNMRSSYGIEANNQRIKFLLDRGAQMRRFIASAPRESDVREMINLMKRTLNRKRIMEFDGNIWRVGSGSPKFVPGNTNSGAIQPLWHVRGVLAR